MGGLVAVDLFHVARELHEFYSLAGTLAHQLVTLETSGKRESSDVESNSEANDLSFIEFARSNLATRLRHLNLALNEGATREFQCNERIREFLGYLHFYLNQHFRIHVSEDPEIGDVFVFGPEEIRYGSDSPQFVPRSSRRGDSFCNCGDHTNCVKPIPEFAMHLEELQIKAELEIERHRASAQYRVGIRPVVAIDESKEPGLSEAEPPPKKETPAGKEVAKNKWAIGPPEELGFRLSPQQQKIFYAMWGGQTITRNELKKAAWPKSSKIKPSSVHDAVHNLLIKLEDIKARNLGIRLEISKGRNRSYRLTYEPPAATDGG